MLGKNIMQKTSATKIVKNSEDQFRQRTLAVMFIVTKAS